MLRQKNSSGRCNMKENQQATSCSVGWTHVTKAGRLGSIRFPVVSHQRLEKRNVAACSASCSLMRGCNCKETVHQRCCYWLATSEALTAKVAACPRGASKRRCRRWPLVQKRAKRNWTELNFQVWAYDIGKCKAIHDLSKMCSNQHTGSFLNTSRPNRAGLRVL